VAGRITSSVPTKRNKGTMKSSVFWDMTCIALLDTCFMLVSYLAYSSTLKMEATGSSEMTFDSTDLHGIVY
jgi:hypothetical protein